MLVKLCVHCAPALFSFCHCEEIKEISDLVETPQNSKFKTQWFFFFYIRTCACSAAGYWLHVCLIKSLMTLHIGWLQLHESVLQFLSLLLLLFALCASLFLTFLWLFPSRLCCATKALQALFFQTYSLLIWSQLTFGFERLKKSGRLSDEINTDVFFFFCFEAELMGPKHHALNKGVSTEDQSTLINGLFLQDWWK